MKNLATNYQELRQKALTNWSTKSYVNEDMNPQNFFCAIQKHQEEKGCELGLTDQILHLLIDWSCTYTSNGNFKDTVKNLNQTFAI